jgi:hypothetical protein
MARASEGDLFCAAIAMISRSGDQAWNDSIPRVLCRHHTRFFNTV